MWVLVMLTFKELNLLKLKPQASFSRYIGLSVY